MDREEILLRIINLLEDRLQECYGTNDRVPIVSIIANPTDHTILYLSSNLEVEDALNLVEKFRESDHYTVTEINPEGGTDANRN